MEVDRKQAIQQLEQLQQTLLKVRDIPLEHPVTVSASIDPGDPVHYPFVSSFGRELWYCCIHAVRKKKLEGKIGLLLILYCCYRYTILRPSKPSALKLVMSYPMNLVWPLLP
jgi:hypothetical protein